MEVPAGVGRSQCLWEVAESGAEAGLRSLGTKVEGGCLLRRRISSERLLHIGCRARNNTGGISKVVLALLKGTRDST